MYPSDAPEDDDNVPPKGPPRGWRPRYLRFPFHRRSIPMPTPPSPSERTVESDGRQGRTAEEGAAAVPPPPSPPQPPQTPRHSAVAMRQTDGNVEADWYSEPGSEDLRHSSSNMGSTLLTEEEEEEQQEATTALSERDQSSITTHEGPHRSGQKESPYMINSVLFPFVLIIYTLLELAAFICLCVGLLSDMFEAVYDPLVPTGSTLGSTADALVESFAVSPNVTMYYLFLWRCSTLLKAAASSTRHLNNTISTENLFSDYCPVRYKLFEATQAFASITLIVVFVCFIYAIVWWMSHSFTYYFPPVRERNWSNPDGGGGSTSSGRGDGPARMSVKYMVALALLTLFGTATGVVSWVCLISVFTAAEGSEADLLSASSSVKAIRPTLPPLVGKKGRCPPLRIAFSCDPLFYAYRNSVSSGVLTDGNYDHRSGGGGGGYFHESRVDANMAVSYFTTSRNSTSYAAYSVSYSRGFFLIVMGWCLHTMNLLVIMMLLLYGANICQTIIKINRCRDRGKEGEKRAKWSSGTRRFMILRHPLLHPLCVFGFVFGYSGECLVPTHTYIPTHLTNVFPHTPYRLGGSLISVIDGVGGCFVLFCFFREGPKKISRFPPSYAICRPSNGERTLREIQKIKIGKKKSMWGEQAQNIMEGSILLLLLFLFSSKLMLFIYIYIYTFVCMFSLLSSSFFFFFVVDHFYLLTLSLSSASWHYLLCIVCPFSCPRDPNPKLTSQHGCGVEVDGYTASIVVVVVFDAVLWCWSLSAGRYLTVQYIYILNGIKIEKIKQGKRYLRGITASRGIWARKMSDLQCEAFYTEKLNASTCALDAVLLPPEEAAAYGVPSPSVSCSRGSTAEAVLVSLGGTTGKRRKNNNSSASCSSSPPYVPVPVDRLPRYEVMIAMQQHSAVFRDPSWHVFALGAPEQHTSTKSSLSPPRASYRSPTGTDVALKILYAPVPVSHVLRAPHRGDIPFIPHEVLHSTETVSRAEPVQQQQQPQEWCLCASHPLLREAAVYRWCQKPVLVTSAGAPAEGNGAAELSCPHRAVNPPLPRFFGALLDAVTSRFPCLRGTAEEGSSLPSVEHDLSRCAGPFFWSPSSPGQRSSSTRLKAAQHCSAGTAEIADGDPHDAAAGGKKKQEEKAGVIVLVMEYLRGVPLHRLFHIFPPPAAAATYSPAQRRTETLLRRAAAAARQVRPKSRRAEEEQGPAHAGDRGRESSSSVAGGHHPADPSFSSSSGSPPPTTAQGFVHRLRAITSASTSAAAAAAGAGERGEKQGKRDDKAVHRFCFPVSPRPQAPLPSSSICLVRPSRYSTDSGSHALCTCGEGSGTVGSSPSAPPLIPITPSFHRFCRRSLSSYTAAEEEEGDTSASDTEEEEQEEAFGEPTEMTEVSRRRLPGPFATPRLPFALVVHLFASTALACAALHDRGVLLGDLKLPNVLLMMPQGSHPTASHPSGPEEPTAMLAPPQTAAAVAMEAFSGPVPSFLVERGEGEDDRMSSAARLSRSPASSPSSSSFSPSPHLLRPSSSPLGIPDAEQSSSSSFAAAAREPGSVVLVDLANAMIVAKEMQQQQLLRTGNEEEGKQTFAPSPPSSAAGQCSSGSSPPPSPFNFSFLLRRIASGATLHLQPPEVRHAPAVWCDNPYPADVWAMGMLLLELLLGRVVDRHPRGTALGLTSSAELLPSEKESEEQGCQEGADPFWFPRTPHQRALRCYMEDILARYDPALLLPTTHPAAPPSGCAGHDHGDAAAKEGGGPTQEEDEADAPHAARAAPTVVRDSSEIPVQRPHYHAFVPHTPPRHERRRRDDDDDVVNDTLGSVVISPENNKEEREEEEEEEEGGEGGSLHRVFLPPSLLAHGSAPHVRLRAWRKERSPFRSSPSSGLTTRTAPAAAAAGSPECLVFYLAHQPPAERLDYWMALYRFLYQLLHPDYTKRLGYPNATLQPREETPNADHVKLEQPKPTRAALSTTPAATATASSSSSLSSSCECDWTSILSHPFLMSTWRYLELYEQQQHPHRDPYPSAAAAAAAAAAPDARTEPDAARRSAAEWSRCLWSRHIFTDDFHEEMDDLLIGIIFIDIFRMSTEECYTTLRDHVLLSSPIHAILWVRRIKKQRFGCRGKYNDAYGTKERSFVLYALMVCLFSFSIVFVLFCCCCCCLFIFVLFISFPHFIFTFTSTPFLWFV
eukprot:gene7486-5273_t